MDRLTEKMNNGEYGFKMSGDVYSIHSLATLEVASMNIENNEEAFRTLSAIAERLAAYENLDFSPEHLKEFDSLYLERCNEINRLNKELLEKTEQLKEYKQLEEQGRVLVLPCKVGDTVYTVPVRGKKEIIEKVIRDVEFRGIKYKEGERFFINASATPYIEREIGKYLFFSKEEAEQALERMSK